MWQRQRSWVQAGLDICPLDQEGHQEVEYKQSHCPHSGVILRWSVSEADLGEFSQFTPGLDPQQSWCRYGISWNDTCNFKSWVSDEGWTIFCALSGKSLKNCWRQVCPYSQRSPESYGNSRCGKTNMISKRRIFIFMGQITYPKRYWQPNFWPRGVCSLLMLGQCCF